MRTLTPSQKGAIAEAAVASAAIRCGLTVLRPLAEGSRYDLVIDTGERLLRVQCKWAKRSGDVLEVRLRTSRRTRDGHVRSRYTAAQIDAIAAFAPDVDRCYMLPVTDVEGGATVSLRLARARNNQSRRIRWARDYELARALANVWGVGPSNAPHPVRVRVP